MLISIIIPCFNAEAWIRETLASVEAQTHPDLEIIVVDDGSTDRSVEVVEAVSSSRIRLIRQANAGAAKARNTGLRAAHGAYLQFLDADDLLSPGKLTIQLTRLQARPGAVASCDWARFHHSPATADQGIDGIDRDLSALEWLLEAWRDGGGMLFPARWLIPRSIAERAGPWDESLSLNDDGEYFTRVVLASEEVLHCPGAWSYYRSGIAGSLSGTKSPQGWRSYFRSVELSIGHARAREDTERVRKCASLLYQRFAYATYPFEPGLANEAMRRARSIHSVDLDPGGGSMFHFVRKVLGWRLARRLQEWHYARRSGAELNPLSSTRSSQER